MLLKNLEEKIKFAKFIVIISFVIQTFVIGLVLFYSYTQISKERDSIYTIVDGAPMVVKRTMMDYNRDYEYKNTINMFHSLFFNLPPDETTIADRMEMAMYLVDENGLKQYNNLKEKGYYRNILSSSANLTLTTDSIVLNGQNFTYYGKQRIERKSSILKRILVTSGTLQDIPRTERNPHGVLIKNWKTIKNKDIDYIEKSTL